MKKGIVVFNPKAGYDSYWHRAPLGALAAVSMLDQDKYDIKVISSYVGRDPIADVLKHVNKLTLCLGISSLTGHQIKEGLAVAKAVREKNPFVKIIWGGFHPSILPKETLENEYVDAVVIGQGPKSFKEIVEHIEAKKSLKGIKGIMFKENGEVIDNSRREFEQLDNFPPIPYNLIDMEKAIQPCELPKSNRLINYFSSMGCPYNCRFCAELKFSNKRWVSLSAEKVIEDIAKLVKEYNIDGVEVLDNNFFVDKERVRKICKGIIAKKLNVGWGNAEGRVRDMLTFEDEIWKLMKESGCKSILIGAESGSQKILDMINKGLTPEEILRLTKKAKEYDIQINFSFMTGLPPTSMKTAKKEVAEEFNATLDLIEKVLEIRNDNNILLFVYCPYPGNELYEKSIEYGMNAPKSLEEWSNFEFENKLTPWVTKSFVNKVAMMRDFIFPYISDLYAERHSRQFRHIHTLFHHTSKWRFKHRFFALPVEYWAFRGFKWIRQKKDERKKK